MKTILKPLLFLVFSIGPCLSLVWSQNKLTDPTKYLNSYNSGLYTADTSQSDSLNSDTLKAKNSPKDSLTPLPKRYAYIGLETSVQFGKWDELSIASNELQTFISLLSQHDSIYEKKTLPYGQDSVIVARRQNSVVLQNYDPVLLMLSLGLSLGYQVNSNFNVFFTSQAGTRQFESIVQYKRPLLTSVPDSLPLSGGSQNISRSFTLTWILLGIGTKFSLPLELISIQPNQALEFGFTAWFDPGYSSIETAGGTFVDIQNNSQNPLPEKKVRFRRSVLEPVGYRFSLGYPIYRWKQLLLKGNLAYGWLDWNLKSQVWNEIFSNKNNVSQPNINLSRLEFVFEVNWIPGI